MEVSAIEIKLEQKNRKYVGQVRQEKRAEFFKWVNMDGFIGKLTFEQRI